MPMSQEERVAADIRVRSLLGVNRMGTGADAPFARPRPGSPLAITSATKLSIDDDVYGLQMVGYGEIWGRPGLPIRERSFLTVALLAATPQPDQLGIHLHNALNLGLTPEEIVEIIVHTGAYAGVSTWHAANNMLRYVFLERGVLQPGTGARYEAKPPTNREDRQAAAEKIQKALGFGRIGLGEGARELAPLPGGPAAITVKERLPVELEIEQVQKEYVFGEVWSRPTLDLRTRALISVASLQALRLDDQLHAHINVALNLGITANELHEVFLHASSYSGAPGWRNAANIANHVFIQHGIVEKA